MLGARDLSSVYIYGRKIAYPVYEFNKLLASKIEVGPWKHLIILKGKWPNPDS